MIPQYPRIPYFLFALIPTLTTGGMILFNFDLELIGVHLTLYALTISLIIQAYHDRR